MTYLQGFHKARCARLRAVGSLPPASLTISGQNEAHTHNAARWSLQVPGGFID